MDDCVFCKIIRNEMPRQIIDENDTIIVFMSLEGHPLVVPKKHFANIYELDDETGAAIMKEAIKIAKAVKNGLQCDGTNLVQANDPAGGQEVFHFHLHVKPRWHNDNVTIMWNANNRDEENRKETIEKIKSALSS